MSFPTEVAQYIGGKQTHQVVREKKKKDRDKESVSFALHFNSSTGSVLALGEGLHSDATTDSTPKLPIGCEGRTEIFRYMRSLKTYLPRILVQGVTG